MSALIIGGAAGIVCYLMVSYVKGKMGYDDSLDVFGCHGIGGTLGMLLTGVFATSGVNAVYKDGAGKAQPVGLIDGNGGQILNQLIAVGIAWGLAIVGTLVALFIVNRVFALRASPDEEKQGLDLSQHGEEGYRLGG
jgi:Amt family ammonium transporter